MRPTILLRNVLFLIAICGIAAGQSGGNYSIKDATVQASGHISSGGPFVVQISLGASVAGGNMSGENYSVAPGFWGEPTPPPVVTLPAAPTMLGASAASTDEINLSWSDNSDNEAHFEIERCDGKGKCQRFEAVGQAGTNETSFMDQGLTAATNYSYRVRAVNSAGSSAFSNTAKVRTSKK